VVIGAVNPATPSARVQRGAPAGAWGVHRRPGTDNGGKSNDAPDVQCGPVSG